MKKKDCPSAREFDKSVFTVCLVGFWFRLVDQKAKQISGRKRFEIFQLFVSLWESSLPSEDGTRVCTLETMFLLPFLVGPTYNLWGMLSAAKCQNITITIVFY